MHSHRWFVVLFTIVATSRAWSEPSHFEPQQNGNADTALRQRSAQGTCKRISALTKLSDLAANQTTLNSMLTDKKLTQEQVDEIKIKKDAINSELQDLSSNTTLLAECGAINAHRKAVRDCKRLDKLEKLAELANNKTAYDEHLAGEVLNQKQLERLKKNMEDAEVKLQKLRSNNTLVELCTKGIGSQQNEAVGQQVGDIGEAAVDNSGVISLSTSGATTLWAKTWVIPYVLALGSFIALAPLQI